jgi:hypothetical protein
MKLPNCLWLLVLFFQSIAICQATDGEDGGNLNAFFQEHMPGGKLKSYESAQQVVSQFADMAMASVIEYKFILTQLEAHPTERPKECLRTKLKKN